jgi:hypothetical protein
MLQIAALAYLLKSASYAAYSIHESETLQSIIKRLKLMVLFAYLQQLFQDDI